jgi:DNA polymerase III subunit epsilon
MNLKIKRPLVFFDLETTGLNTANDRIVEIALIKIYPNGNEDIKHLRLNPEIPISEEATAIHGISNEDVKDEPNFKKVAKDLAKFLEGCDIAGYNSNKFDVPLLVEEFLRADVDFDMKKRNLIDVQVIFMKKEPRTLEAAYKYYCKKDLIGAHGALADTKATFEVLKSQIEHYEDLPDDVEELSKFSSHNKFADFAGRLIYDEQNQEVVNFGKYKGKLLEDVLTKDPGYYSWVQQADFPLYTKKIFTEVYLRLKSKS